MCIRIAGIRCIVCVLRVTDVLSSGSYYRYAGVVVVGGGDHNGPRQHCSGGCCHRYSCAVVVVGVTRGW